VQVEMTLVFYKVVTFSIYINHRAVLVSTNIDRMVEYHVTNDYVKFEPFDGMPKEIITFSALIESSLGGFPQLRGNILPQSSG
jgi:hypothetical protein